MQTTGPVTTKLGIDDGILKRQVSGGISNLYQTPGHKRKKKGAAEKMLEMQAITGPVKIGKGAAC